MYWYPDFVAFCNIFTWENLQHAVCGGLGSAFAISVFFPLETARTRLQVDDKQKACYSPLLVWSILKEEGIAGLYRGWWSLVLSLFLTNYVYFYVFHGLKALLCREGYSQHVVADLFFGIIAGSAAVLVTNPLWVVNTRLKLQGAKLKTQQLKQLKHPPYSGITDCLHKIVKYEGMRTLWSGSMSSLLLVSNPAIQFMTYEALKRQIIPLFGLQTVLSLLHFSNGAIAKVVATVTTYPLQVVQTRVRAGYKEGEGVLRTLRHILRSSGLAGLFRGLESKLTQTVLTAALMFLTYEQLIAAVRGRG